MARPPLSTRWGNLLMENRMAQRGSLLAWLVITKGIFPAIYLPACWPYVAAVISLQLGLLAFLDYRDWVRDKVQEEASKLDPSLSVSSMLLLSSPGLQDQYYTWMDRTPAVTWHPYFLPFFHVIVGQRILNRAEDGCTGFALIVSLPCTLLASVRVAMECSGAPKQLQSIASLVALAYFVTVFTGMMALHDPCTLSIGPDWTISPAGNAVYVALVAAVQIALTPCVMQHLAALCVITSSLDLFLACFIWSQQRHGGLGLSSYPTHYVELGIIIAAARTATLLVGAAVRYRLAHGNMKAFLRSARRPHRH